LPSRGLVAAAALIGVALTCLASLRKLERERRLLGRLKQDSGALALESLSEDERYTARELERAGVVHIEGRRVQVRPARLTAFRARRLRVLFSGFLVALVLAAVVMLVLRH
jgi:hypothetical protein